MRFKQLFKVLWLVPLLILGGCGVNSQQSTKLPTTYQSALKQAKGQTVTYYGFGGSDTQNRWLDQVIKPMMKEKGITLKRVPMDIEDIISKLTTETI